MEEKIEPEVGMGATIIYWSDREPATITEVSKDFKKVWIVQDDAKRTDSNGASEDQRYEYTSKPRFTEEGEDTAILYTLRKNGRYVRKGDTMNGNSILIGRRRKYHDYSF